MIRVRRFYTGGGLMSEYPAWWDKTVTLYGRPEDGGQWTRTVLRGVFVSFDAVGVREGRRGVPGGGVDSAALMRVPEGSAEMRAGDLVVLGEVFDRVDDYAPGQGAGELLAKYRERPGAFEVARVTDNTGYPGGHWHVESVRIGYYGR